METWTFYKGQAFASDLAARWAVFFDALSIKWQYGSVGLGLEKVGWYGPLFRLERPNMWIEVRPWPDGLEAGEFWPEHLAWTHGPDNRLLFPEFSRLVVICGAPLVHMTAAPGTRIEDTRMLTPRSLGYEGFVDERPGYLWCECPRCGAVGMTLEGRVDRLCECNSFTGDRVYNTFSRRLLDAYCCAEDSRLGHGPVLTGGGPWDAPAHMWRN